MASIDPAKALVPRPDDEARVRSGLRKKLLRVAARIPFASDVMALYFAARDPETPRKTKALIMAALAYFVVPTDAVPDIFAGIGFTDDAAVIAAIIALSGSAIRPKHRKLAKAFVERLKGSA